jgi:putative endonuclease
LSSPGLARICALGPGDPVSGVGCVYEHKTKAAEGFTKQYGVDRLVYFEHFDNIEYAMLREKRLKKWKREWKIALIEKDNPNWDDLYPIICR